MRKIKKQKRTELNRPLIGAMVGLLICTGLLSIFSLLLLSQRIGEKYSEWIVTIALLIASVVGNFTSKDRRVKSFRNVVITSAAMILIMFVGSFSINGAFDNVLLRVGPVLIGGAVTCVFCLKNTGTRGKRKKRHC